MENTDFVIIKLQSGKKTKTKTKTKHDTLTPGGTSEKGTEFISDAYGIEPK